MRKEVYICEKRRIKRVHNVHPTCMHECRKLFTVKKRRVYVKRDAYTGKETYMSGNRPTLRVRDVLPVCMHKLKETFNLKQRCIYLKRDVYVWK